MTTPSERERSAVDPASDFCPAPVQAPAMSPAGRLQQAAGNQAVARAVATSRSELPTVEAAAAQLRRAVVTPSPRNLDEAYATVSLLHGQIDDIKAAYRTANGTDLTTDLAKLLPPHEVRRAKLIIERGRLRLADKLFLAVEQDGFTDEETLFRLLPKVRGDSDAEAEFAAEYGKHFDYKGGDLPDGTTVQSAIVGMLEDELSGWELDKAKALYTFGKLRPVDDIRIATNRIGTEAAMLFKALEDGMNEAPGSDAQARKASLQAQYATSYPDDEPLDVLLRDELSWGEYDRAKLILQGRATEGKIALAVGGDTDEDAIFKAIADAPASERLLLHNKLIAGREAAKLQASSLTRAQRDALEFYEQLDGDLSAADIERLEAGMKLDVKNDGGMAVLAAAGVKPSSDGDDLLEAVLVAGSDELEAYRRAYKSDPDFHRHVASMLDDREFGELRIMLEGSVKERLELAMGTDADWHFGTEEEYIFKVLEDAPDAEKRALAADDAFLTHVRRWELSTRDYNRVLDLLRPKDESVEERIAGTEAQIERESSWITAGMSEDWALRDQAREMRVQLTRAKRDGTLTPEEQEKLLAAEADTREALEVYERARDEMQELAVQVITIAAGIIVGAFTAGAGAAAITAWNLTKSAVVMAVTRVLATKAAKGDQFDIFGADGATAFGAGAIEGVMAVAGPIGANKITSALIPSAKLVAAEGGELVFAKFGPRLLSAAIEEGMGEGAEALFESVVQASDMRARMEDKFLMVAGETGSSVLKGAAMGAVKEAASSAKDALFTSADGSGPAVDGSSPDVEGTAPADGHPALPAVDDHPGFDEAFGEYPSSDTPADTPAGFAEDHSVDPLPESPDPEFLDEESLFGDSAETYYGERTKPPGHGPDDYEFDEWAEHDAFDPDADAEYGVDHEHATPEVFTNEPSRRDGPRDPAARTTDRLPVLGRHAGSAHGNVMDDVASWGYLHRELYLDVKGKRTRRGRQRRVRLDSWNPRAAGGHGEIVSRKSGRAGQLAHAGIEPLQELVAKYKAGMTISDVRSSPAAYRGKALFGRPVLEVPRQDAAIPQDVIDYAKKHSVTIRDWHGKVYFDPFAKSGGD